MNHPPRLLVDTHTVLADAVRTIGSATRHLTALTGPWSTTTALAGNPGTGRGAHPTIDIDGDQVPITPVEAAALHGRDHAAALLARIDTLTKDCARHADLTVLAVLGQHPTPPWPSTLTRTVHAYRCAHLLLNLTHFDHHAFHELRPWHSTAEDLTKLTTCYATTRTPTIAPTEQRRLATDLTGNWCPSCLRVGTRAPRYRTDDLCRWCRDFRLTYNTEPPYEVVNARANGTTGAALGSIITNWARRTTKQRHRGTPA